MGRYAQLEAGYRDNDNRALLRALIGRFDKVRVSHIRNDRDWVTRIEGGDGRAALQRPIFFSVNPGYNAFVLLGRIVEKLDLFDRLRITNKALDTLKARSYARGFTVQNTAWRAIEKIAERSGVEAHVQDGQLWVLSPEDDGVDISAPVLSSETGLLGSPARRHDPAHPHALVVYGTSLLNPKIIPGGRIVLKSSTQSGTFKVTKATHRGDTHGGGQSWITTWEGIART